MLKITLIDSNGISRTITAEPGISVMAAARQNDIPEILAECGGVCTCSTCHVHVEPEWFDKTGTMSRIENGLLSLQEERSPGSRLSCQIKMTAELDGLVVHTLALDPDDD